MDSGFDHFDVVVVGSGFGGSVMAARMAEAGKSVCVLERGRAYAPGDFARTPTAMTRNVWDPDRGRYGLFDVWSFEHADAIVSAGLGGGSLIYANVLIRKDEHWFVRDGYRGGAYEYWPVTRADLDPHYAIVEQRLNAQVYPLDTPPYANTAKTNAMRDAAGKLGIAPTTHDRVDSKARQWYLPLLAVTFANDGEEAKPGRPIRDDENYHGAARETCRLCGECDIGCNFGAKNTLDFNYISAAWRAKADIRTLSEVTRFEPRDGRPGYLVHYSAHADDVSRPRAVTADTLVIACGTLGSNFLMLKHNATFGDLSPTLGTRFCGNGDAIDVAFSCERPIEGSRGPVITSTIRYPDAADNGVEAGRGFYLQDAGYPAIVDWLLELADVPAVSRRAGNAARKLVERVLGDAGNSEIGSAVGAMFGGELSSSTLTMLCMGREVPDGFFTVTRRKNGEERLDLAWTNALARPYIDRVLSETGKLGKALGGTFVPNPLARFLNRMITVHPVGGCPMGRNANEGVVNSYGEVFGRENLFVLDGSIMPGPVGPNPSLTIAALSNRAADHILSCAR